jgi:predicted RNA-binding Zn-ribbon protein involved in translation (DUF1610 family)
MENDNSKNESNNVNTLLTTVICRDCGSKYLKQWREGDGRGFVERYKCEDCGYVGENLKVGHYSG